MGTEKLKILDEAIDTLTTDCNWNKEDIERDDT